MASVFQRPDSKFWFAAYRAADDRRVKAATKTEDKAEAQRIADRLELEARETREKRRDVASLTGVNDAVQRATQLAMSGRLDALAARELINDLLAATGQEAVNVVSNRVWCENWRAAKKGAVGERSRMKYSQVCRDWLKFLNGKADKPLEAVSRTETIGFRDRMLGDGLSARTVNQTIKLLRGIYTEALEEGHIPRNPFAGVKNLREAVTDENGEQKKRLPFTVAEVACLIKTAEGDWEGLVILAGTTGLRLVDGARLSADKLDRVAGTIRLKSRKTGALLFLPIHPDFEAWLSKRDVVKGTAPIFPSLATMGGAGRSGLSMAFKRLMQRAGIDAGVVRAAEKNGRGRTTSQKSFHSLRHFAATQLAVNGVRGEVARAITGHTDEDTHEGYVTPDIQVLRAAVNGIRLAA